MVVTRTELSEIVNQINKKFDELENRIKELESVKNTKTTRKTTTTAKAA
tara:strand:- start:444 stop:590 length:147 start_codon:yes stop_codon:yes gene_type:complete